MSSLSFPRQNPTAASASRTRRQQGLFLGGVAFVVFSSIITRRALTRRYRPSPSASPATPISKGPPRSGQAPGYSPASAVSKPSTAAAEGAQAADAAPDINNHGPIMAVEALTLATLNVVSWAIMVTGGALWALDIGNLDDMRRLVRGGLGVDGTGRTEQDAEEELEEWLATVLARKEEKKLRGLDGPVRDEKGRER